mmetsp:Transcript_26361/g.63572  ORF Transcript_26361/g.63572 Transcript_26361/m.63572 type:complete len:655 (-) Transcript_26361:252-2216(-)
MQTQPQTSKSNVTAKKDRSRRRPKHSQHGSRPKKNSNAGRNAQWRPKRPDASPNNNVAAVQISQGGPKKGDPIYKKKYQLNGKHNPRQLNKSARRGRGGRQKWTPKRGAGNTQLVEFKSHRDVKNGTHFTHLLGFSYGDAPSRDQREIRTKGRRQRSVPFDKERFVQANYRFVVNKWAEGVQECMDDADFIVSWKSVEEVIHTTTTIPSCPICMDTPICPKITKCGHIFCWTCVLQYMAVGGQKWKRCPLCFESVYLDALKSLRFTIAPDCKLGEKIIFNLVERKKDSILPKFYGERCTALRDSLQDPSKSSVLHRATPTQNIIPILEREQSELCEMKRKILSSEAQEKADLSRNLPFIESALDSVLKRRTAWLKTRQPLSSDCKNMSSGKSKLTSNYDPSADSFNDEECGTDACETPVKPKSKLSASAAAWTPASQRDNRSESFYFYQGSAGQHIFLHGINYRCLIHEYGHVNKIPRTIECKVLWFEKFSQTSQTRFKYKFLKHLPLTTEITICFVDVHVLVSKETLAEFREPLLKMKRKLEKLRKARKQEDERKKRHERMIQQMSIVPNDSDYFVIEPQWEELHENAFPDLVEAKLSDGERSAKSTPSSSPVITGFADVIKNGYSEQNWPSLPGTASGGDAPPAVRRISWRT